VDLGYGWNVVMSMDPDWESSNQSPKIIETSPSQYIEMNEGDTQEFYIYAMDENNETLSYTWSLDGMALNDNTTNQMTFFANYSSSGFHILMVVVSDGEFDVEYEWSVTIYYKEPPKDDDDKDGLPDYWEEEHFGDLLQTGNDDPDEDGFTNQDEYFNGTDPKTPNYIGPDFEGDKDGMPDSWEMKHFGNLDEGPTDDYDGDGYTNLNEYLNSTDPSNPYDLPRLPDDDDDNEHDEPDSEDKDDFAVTMTILVGLGILCVGVIGVLVYLRTKEVKSQYPEEDELESDGRITSGDQECTFEEKESEGTVIDPQLEIKKKKPKKKKKQNVPLGKPVETEDDP